VDRKVLTAHRVNGKLVHRPLSPEEARALARDLLDKAREAECQPMSPGDVIREVTGGNRS
jgi:hypothetical protein